MTVPPSLFRLSSRLAASLLLAAFAAGAAQAAPKDALERCVDLAPGHDVVRSGGDGHFLLRSGGEHYRVAFSRGCGSLATASRIAIGTDGQEGRLCPSGTTVDTGRDRCPVREVKRIEAEQFQREQRRRR